MTDPLTLLSPRNDAVFKMLLARNRPLLIDLVNLVLVQYGYPHLTELFIDNAEVTAEQVGQKFIALDIHARDEAHHHYDIEMQVRSHAAYAERALYYLSKLNAQQLLEGQRYAELRRVIGIHFLNFDLFPDDPQSRWAFELRDRHRPEIRLTDQLALLIFELQKQPLAEGSALDQWVRFL
ncbi:MAG: Rpn family recombination-promoting nuclease/putative transposase, partial [Candidatus Competibacterales bacterium]